MDIGNKSGNHNDCGGICTSSSSCSHFTWTDWNGGTCWLKGGDADWKKFATKNNDDRAVCGFIKSQNSMTGKLNYYFYINLNKTGFFPNIFKVVSKIF